MTDSLDNARDFDFEFGTWRVLHRRLQGRLCGCTIWDEFTGTARVQPILGGFGNLEDNELDFPGGAYRAVALRSFDRLSGNWAIWWLDERDPHRLDVPVIGRFSDGVGCFLAEDILDGRPVKVRFLWLDTATQTPRWEQALSDDGGMTWETNWTMKFERLTAG